MKLNIFKKEKKSEPASIDTAENNQPSDQKKAVASSVGAIQHTTEKAGFLGGLNQYVFKVAGDANKIEIKKDIEKKYNVKVEAVKILNMPSKLRRLGRTEGIKSGFKKAIIKLQKGHKIDLAKTK